MDKEFSKRKHKPMSLMITLSVAIVVGLGLVSLSDMTKMNYPYAITGNVVKEVGSAPTTPEALDVCKTLYEDHYNYCSVTWDGENEYKNDCYREAKENCFDCVLSTKNPTDGHLREYCYK